MAIRKIEVLSPKAAQKAARRQQGSWLVAESTDIIDALIKSPKGVVPASLTGALGYIARPTLYKLQNTKSTTYRVGHKGVNYTSTLTFFGKHVIGVMELKIGSHVHGDGFSVVCPTGVLNNEETPKMAACRETEEETRIQIHKYWRTGPKKGYRVLDSRHVGIRCHTYLAHLDSQRIETLFPKDKGEELFICAFTVDDWCKMYHRGYLEEGTMHATTAALPYHKKLAKAFKRSGRLHARRR